MNQKTTKALDIGGFLTVHLGTLGAASLLFYGYVGPWIGSLVAHALFAAYATLMAGIALDRARKDDWSLTGKPT